MTFETWWNITGRHLKSRYNKSCAKDGWNAAMNNVELAQLSHNTGSPKCAQCGHGAVVVKCDISAEPDSNYCHKNRTLRAGA